MCVFVKIVRGGFSFSHHAIKSKWPIRDLVIHYGELLRGAMGGFFTADVRINEAQVGGRKRSCASFVACLGESIV